jgi:hypothetical protein
MIHLPRTGLIIEARDAILNRSERLPERSGIVAEALSELTDADGFMDVAAHEYAVHAFCDLTNGPAPDGLP